MDTVLIVIYAVGGTFVFALVMLAVYGTAMQRRAIRTQERVVSQTLPGHKDAMAHMRESMEMQRETLTIQREVIGLLRRIATASERP